jgi:CubicO group peptidase (beta-lactamase class C family)
LKFKFFFLLIIAVLIAACTESKQDKFDAYLKYCYSNHMFNGTILIIEQGDIIYENSFGLADFKTKRELTNSSAFYLASVSKQFTSMAVLILKEQGKLALDDPIQKYFPDYPDFAQNVTIRHLLTHTSGIHDHFALGSYKPDLTNQEVYDLLIQQDSLQFNPGTEYRYSNGAYVLLAMLVEKASGQPFHIFMREQIFGPLGMERTLVYDESKPEIADRAIGFTTAGERADYDILTSGAGGIYSTTEDLARWDRALYSGILVSKATLEEAYTPYTLADGKSTDYGFGWSIESLPDEKILHHSGGLAGFRTYIERHIRNHNAIIFLTNIGSDINQIRKDLRQILLDGTFEYPKIPADLAIEKFLAQKDRNQWPEFIDTLYQNNNGKYDFNESGVNELGYRLIEKNLLSEAIAVLQLNVKLFPDSANVYDSLGDAYKAAQKTDLAIKNYSIAVELAQRQNHPALETYRNNLHLMQSMVKKVK